MSPGSAARARTKASDDHSSIKGRRIVDQMRRRGLYLSCLDRFWPGRGGRTAASCGFVQYSQGHRPSSGRQRCQSHEPRRARRRRACLRAEPGSSAPRRSAQLVVVNGLGLESWLTRLVRSAHYRGPSSSPAAASPRLARPSPARQSRDRSARLAGCRQRHCLCRNIARALMAADPAHAEAYRERSQRYQEELRALDRQVREAIAAVPTAKRRVITTHDAFAYYGRAYGVAFLAPEGMNDRQRALGAGDRRAGPADPAGGDQGTFSRKHLRPAADAGARPRDRRRTRPAALFRRIVAPRRAGRDLCKHARIQYCSTEGGDAQELNGFAVQPADRVAARVARGRSSQVQSTWPKPASRSAAICPATPSGKRSQFKKRPPGRSRPQIAR